MEGKKKKKMISSTGWPLGTKAKSGVFGGGDPKEGSEGSKGEFNRGRKETIQTVMLHNKRPSGVQREEVGGWKKRGN